VSDASLRRRTRSPERSRTTISSRFAAPPMLYGDCRADFRIGNALAYLHLTRGHAVGPSCLLKRPVCLLSSPSRPRLPTWLGRPPRNGAAGWCGRATIVVIAPRCNNRQRSSCPFRDRLAWRYGGCARRRGCALAIWGSRFLLTISRVRGSATVLLPCPRGFAARRSQALAGYARSRSVDSRRG